ncbi:LAME_0B00650g1_1 [Lachancea meyersii CBS 8951]|uniref:Peroxisome assembly protein 22 n=1 Tax=Lachancea meyersii CBS 8951 TaxID=1266667 RepID=A0A1G4IT78_9SACH|nr:LAME_0B00650g1_1 [Lachancea meyersii CBS 8951]
MSSRRSRNRLSGLLAAGALMALVIGVSYAWKKSRDSLPSSRGEKSERCSSVCIVLTKDIYESGVDWDRLLNLSAVVIVPPGSTAESGSANFPGHQIIKCSTEEGVWSVVRHLRKDIVVVSPGQLESLPEDIHRFSKPLTKVP